MKLSGPDILSAVREAVGIKPECPMRSVQIGAAFNSAATLTVELVLTAEQLEQICDAVNTGAV